MAVYEEYFRFEIGDIVRENEVIAWYDDGPMTGIVISLKRDNYFFYYSDTRLHQDRIDVFWFRAGYLESLPSDLLTLVSRI